MAHEKVYFRVKAYFRIHSKGSFDDLRVAIGLQYSYAEVMQALDDLISEGELREFKYYKGRR